MSPAEKDADIPVVDAHGNQHSDERDHIDMIVAGLFTRQKTLDQKLRVLDGT